MILRYSPGFNSFWYLLCFFARWIRTSTPRIPWWSSPLPLSRLPLVFLASLCPGCKWMESLTIRYFKAYLVVTGPAGGGKLCCWFQNLFSSSRLLRKFLTLSNTAFWNFKQSSGFALGCDYLLVGECDKISLDFSNLEANFRILWVLEWNT